MALNTKNSENSSWQKFIFARHAKFPNHNNYTITAGDGCFHFCAYLSLAYSGAFYAGVKKSVGTRSDWYTVYCCWSVLAEAAEGWQVTVEARHEEGGDTLCALDPVAVDCLAHHVDYLNII